MALLGRKFGSTKSMKFLNQSHWRSKSQLTPTVVILATHLHLYLLFLPLLWLKPHRVNTVVFIIMFTLLFAPYRLTYLTFWCFKFNDAVFSLQNIVFLRWLTNYNTNTLSIVKLWEVVTELELARHSCSLGLFPISSWRRCQKYPWGWGVPKAANPWYPLKILQMALTQCIAAAKRHVSLWPFNPIKPNVFRSVKNPGGR